MLLLYHSKPHSDHISHPRLTPHHCSLPLLLPSSTEFDLESLRSTLDCQGLSIAELQDLSVNSRKSLADKTKDFRKSNTPDVIKMVGPLLKSYQEEVDRLTARAKHGETAFLELYKRLYEAPDPAPTLASGLEKMSRLAESKAQVKKLAQELSEYRAESMEIKNQDFKIRKLEEKVRSLEAMNEEKDKLLEESVRNAEEEASIKILAEVRSREAALEEELAKAQGSVESMRRAHAMAEETVFKLQSRGEEENALAREEAEMAVEELQRAQAQLAALEAERNALLEKSKECSSSGVGGVGGDKNANAASPSDVAAGTSSTTTGVNTVDGNIAGTVIMEELQKEVAAQRELISCLEKEAADLRTQAAESTSTWSERCDALKVALEAKEAHVAALESQLAARPLQRQLDELKARVRLLQAVGFGATEDDEESMGGGGGGDEEGWGDEDEQEGKTPSAVVVVGGEGSRTMKTRTIGGRSKTGGPSSSSSSSSLEAALMEKCRKLEHDLTMARLAASDASAAVEAALQRAVDAEADAAAQKELIARMEEDLLLYTSSSSGGGGSGTVPNGTAVDINSLKLDKDNLYINTANTTTITSSSALVNEDAVISVLSHQRDRLRLRVTELEERAAEAAQSLVEATNQATTLKADNIALVERLKYVQSYGNNATTCSDSNGNRRGSSGGGRSSLLPQSSIDVEDGLGSARNNTATTATTNNEGVVGKYMPEYEESINPFSDFRARERDARRKALSIQDRTALALGKLVSGSAAARTAVFTYLMVLHMGVFFVLAGYSHKQAGTLEGLGEACAKLRQFSSGNGGGGMVGRGSGDDDPVLGRLLLY
jgi:homeobox protein cut-like